MRPSLVFASLSLLLASCAASAATPAAAEPAPPPAASTAAAPAPRLSPADQKRVDAIHQYQHDLVSVVALRADPDFLLGAALLARPFKQQIPELGFDALSERASAAPAAGPATRWVRLGLCKDESNCPNPEAYGYLKKHAADNAAVWIVALDIAAANKDDKAEQAALAKAAAAKAYDDYYGKVLAGVAKAVEVLPPLPDTMAGAHDGQPDNQAGVRMLVAAMGASGDPRPNLEPVVDLCAPSAVGKDHARKQTCLKLAHTLQWGSSPSARAAGLHIQALLDPASREQLDASMRDLAWQVQQYSAARQRALVDEAAAKAWLATARNGGTELSLMLATLHASGIPTQAPADFQPASASASP